MTLDTRKTIAVFALTRDPAKHRTLAEDRGRRFRESRARGPRGHAYSFQQVPRDVFAKFFTGAADLAEMFGWFEAHTYLGSDWTDRIALAREIAGRAPTPFATWARTNLAVTQSERKIA
jgi:hypothetical protein